MDARRDVACEPLRLFARVRDVHGVAVDGAASMEHVWRKAGQAIGAAVDQIGGARFGVSLPIVITKSALTLGSVSVFTSTSNVFSR